VTLPEGVQQSTKLYKGKVYVYYYWCPGRSTKRQADRIKLPDPEKTFVAFSRELERLQNLAQAACPAGSIGDLITRYRASEEFKKNSESTKSNYEVHMRRFENREGWVCSRHAALSR
jgi:hypothetical protein